jgi:predicted negative regulator of RcsB-dependent stress response
MMNVNKTNLIINLFKKNKKKLFLILSLLVLVLFIVLFINEKNKTKNVRTANEFNKAIVLLSKNEKESKKILINIIKEKNKFYSPLSLNTLIEKEIIKDKKEIIDLFNIVLSIKKISEENKNLIIFKKALFLTVNGTEADLLNSLNPIINSSSIWRNDSLNLLIEYFLYKNEKNKALQYQALLNKKS